MTTSERTLTTRQERLIRYFLHSGQSDQLTRDWPGGWYESGKRADEAMRGALLDQTLRLSAGKHKTIASDLHAPSLMREKVSPMVNGLFPKAERENVLTMLEKSLIFVCEETIEEIIKTCCLKTAWELANVYLESIGAQRLSRKAPRFVGLSENTKCFVALDYFDENGKFADFIVHEAAHSFHNCRRSTVNLPETRTREHLLTVDFDQRETFAYACEVYSRILTLSSTPKERLSLCDEALDEFVPPCENVDMEKFRLALMEAVRARNGWKKILAVCAMRSVKRTHL